MVVGLGLGSLVGLGLGLPVLRLWLSLWLRLRLWRLRLWAIRRCQPLQSSGVTAQTCPCWLLPWLHRRGFGATNAPRNPGVRAGPRLRKLISSRQSFS